MPNYKSGRLSEDIKREISVISRELKDPRIAGELLTIVRCDVASDNSYCKVYISSIDGFDKAKQAVKGFESASGFIKRELSNRLHLKRCPELKFIADNSMEHSVEINRLLKENAAKDSPEENS